ncbi:hypothetical protein CLOM_g19453, partial [Closterium sp. NIES-68]
LRTSPLRNTLRLRQGEFRQQRRLVTVEAKQSKEDAVHEKNVHKRHGGWRESAGSKTAAASSSPSTTETPATTDSVPAASSSVTAADTVAINTSVPGAVPGAVSGDTSSSEAASEAAAAPTAEAAAAAAESVSKSSPGDSPLEATDAAVTTTAAEAAMVIGGNPLPAISTSAQEAVRRARDASSNTWQSLATAAAEPVALPKQLQESVQALPLPPSLKGRLGIAEGSVVQLTRGQLAAGLLVIGLLVRGIQSWLKSRSNAANSESTVPAPLLPATPNLPTVPGLPPIPIKRMPQDPPNPPDSSSLPNQSPRSAIPTVAVPIMPSSAAAAAAVAAAPAVAAAGAGAPAAAAAGAGAPAAAAAAAAAGAGAPAAALLVETAGQGTQQSNQQTAPDLPSSDPPFERFTTADSTRSIDESREEASTKPSWLPPSFFKFSNSLPPLRFPFTSRAPSGKTFGGGSIDMEEIDRMAAAAARGDGSESESEIDDRPRLIKLQQDNAVAWFALTTGFLVLVAYAWNPANPLNP